MALARGSSAGALPRGARPAVRVGVGKLPAGLLCRTGRRRERPSVQPGASWCSLREGDQERPGEGTARRGFACGGRGSGSTSSFRKVARGLRGHEATFPAHLRYVGFSPGIGPWGGGGRNAEGWARAP